MTKEHPFPGFLIAIEGIDGTGKTTLAHYVLCALQARKLPTIRTKEPTTGHWGQILRDSALTGRLSLEEEVDAFIKDRKEHVETQINPELAAGHIVIVDRYYFSNMAYQGARGISPEEIMRRNEVFAPEPDLLVVLDVEPKTGLQRIKTRGDRANHFEQTDSLKKAREIFLSIKKPYLYLLDARQEPKVLGDLVVSRFVELYSEKMRRSGKTAKQAANAT